MKIIASRRIAIALGIMTLLLNSFTIAGENFISFPGKTSEILSPNKKYVLYNVDLEYVEPNHFLFLVDIRSKTFEKFYEYNRHVGILWSPDGNSLLINDFGGSDYSNTVIFSFDGKKKKIDVLKELWFKITGKEKKSIFENHHVYIEGVQWLSNEKVEINIHGYGDVDPDGFTLWYEYTLGSEFKLIIK